MWDPSQFDELKKLPRLHSTRSVPLEDRVIYEHIYAGGRHWYVAEYDPADRILFGCTVNDDSRNAEWAYISLDELREIGIQRRAEVGRDPCWEPRKASEVDGIPQNKRRQH